MVGAVAMGGTADRNGRIDRRIGSVLSASSVPQCAGRDNHPIGQLRLRSRRVRSITGSGLMISGKAKALFLLAVMFGLGAASGALWKSRHGHREFWKSPDYVERRLKKMTSRLHLSPEEQQKIPAIIEKSQDRMTQGLTSIHQDSVQSIGP